MTFALLAVIFLPFSTPGPALTDRDTIVLADFVNTTGEPVFDRALKVALAVALEQSPFLRVLSDERVRETLACSSGPSTSRSRGRWQGISRDAKAARR